MLFNKKLKNIVKTAPLIFLTTSLPFVSIACYMIPPRMYGVNEEWKIGGLNIKFDLLEHEKIGDFLEIKTTFTFTPTESKFYLDKNFITIDSVGIYRTTIYADEEKSREISKLDVFGTISNKTTCTYIFDISISLFDEKNKTFSTESVAFDMYLFNKHDFPGFSIDYYNLYK